MFNYRLGYRTVNLIMTKCYSEKGGNYSKKSYNFHFSTISNMNRLLGEDGNKAKQLCYFCHQRYTFRHNLTRRVSQCKKFESHAVKLPGLTKDGQIPFHYFSNTYKKLKVSYVVYADMECLLKRLWKGKARKQKILSDLNFESFVMKEKRYQCSSFSSGLIRSDGKVVKKQVYKGPNAVPIFLKQMAELRDKVFQLNRIIKPVFNDPKVLNSIKDVKNCHICENPLGTDIVLDHDHVTGQIRSYAHNECNMNFKQRNKLFILFHNLINYGNHLIINGVRKFEKIRVVPAGSSEKFLSIEIDHMTFFDSISFFIYNLGSLVDNLTASSHKFPILKQVYRADLIPLLTRKDVFCYDYIDQWGKFKKKSLPKRNEFYNLLTDHHVSVKDYRHAKKVYAKFKCKSVGAYHDLYLMSDTLLLAEVFENFRKTALAHYKIDPVYYYSTPGLAWEAALLFTKIRLEKIVEIDMYLFFEEAMK